MVATLSTQLYDGKLLNIGTTMECINSKLPVDFCSIRTPHSNNEGLRGVWPAFKFDLESCVGAREQVDPIGPCALF